MRSPRTAMKSSPHSLQLEEARVQQRRPNAATQKQTSKQTALEVLSNMIRKRNRRRVLRRKELSLFINDMIMYVKNPKEPTGKHQNKNRV